jgi:hypothetical protein
MKRACNFSGLGGMQCDAGAQPSACRAVRTYHAHRDSSMGREWEHSFLHQTMRKLIIGNAIEGHSFLPKKPVTSVNGAMINVTTANFCMIKFISIP